MVRGPDGPRARWSEDLWNKSEDLWNISNTNILILGLAGPRTIGPSDYRTLGLLGLGLSDPRTIRICNIFQGFHTHTHTHTRTHTSRARTRRAHAHTHVLSYIHIHTYTRIKVKAGEPRGKPPGTPESRSWLMPLVTQSSTINIFSLCLGIRLHV